MLVKLNYARACALNTLYYLCDNIGSSAAAIFRAYSSIFVIPNSIRATSSTPKELLVAGSYSECVISQCTAQDK
jgi:hypothetical protein